MIYFPEKMNFSLSHNDQDLSQNKEDLILVDLGGAIINPGPYKVKKTMRLYELVELSGGFDNSVDKEYLSKNFNLVEELLSNQKIYIPYKSENFSQNNSIKEFISINGATASELQKLPKIGEVTAKKILNSRPFQNLNDLVANKIISQKVFEEIEKEIKL
jgi:competence protein ComEA